MIGLERTDSGPSNAQQDRLLPLGHRRRCPPRPEGRDTFVKKSNKRSSRSSAKSTRLPSVARAPALIDEAALLCDLRTLVQSARQRIATVANSTYALICWQVGHRLLRENLQTGRAVYGKQILATVSQELTAEFGAGFGYTALTRMARSLLARKPRSDSSCALPPMPSRWSCWSSMPNPSGSASTSRSCRRCRCSAPGCTRR